MFLTNPLQSSPSQQFGESNMQLILSMHDTVLVLLVHTYTVFV